MSELPFEVTPAAQQEQANTSATVMALPAPGPLDALLAPGQPPLHMTVFYFGDATELSEEAHDGVLELLSDAATSHHPGPSGTVNGYARLGKDNALVALVESQTLSVLRDLLSQTSLVSTLLAGVEQYPQWIPHITLGYGDQVPPQDQLDALVGQWVTFESLALWWGDEQNALPFGGGDESDDESDDEDDLAELNAMLDPAHGFDEDDYDDELTAAAFASALHPRGRDGKFIEKFGVVKWLDNLGRWNYGKVQNIVDEGNGVSDVQVRRSDLSGNPLEPGELEILHLKPKQLYAAPKPKASLKIADGTKTGAQAGSNPGGFYEFPNPQTKIPEKFYVKEAKSLKQGNNEVLANALYEEAGVNVPEVGMTDGKIHSKIVPGVMDMESQIQDPDSVWSKSLRRDYAVDAWLGNWDVFGLTWDNVLTSEDSEMPVRIDNGGALLYRAQGSPKGTAFDTKVGELDTFRTGKKAQVYGPDKLTKTEELDGAQRVLAVSPERIKELVAQNGLPPSLAATLIGRRVYIAEYYGLPLPESLPDPETSAPILDVHDAAHGGGLPRTYSEKLPLLSAMIILQPGDTVHLPDGGESKYSTDLYGKISKTLGYQQVSGWQQDYGIDAKVQIKKVAQPGSVKVTHGGKVSPADLPMVQWERGDKVISPEGTTYDVLGSHTGMQTLLLRAQTDEQNPEQAPWLFSVRQNSGSTTSWTTLSHKPPSAEKVKADTQPDTAPDVTPEAPVPESDWTPITTVEQLAQVSAPPKSGEAVAAANKIKDDLVTPLPKGDGTVPKPKATAAVLGDKSMVLGDGTSVSPGNEVVSKKDGKTYVFVKPKGYSAVVTDPNSDDPTKQYMKTATTLSQPGKKPDSSVSTDTADAPKTADGKIPLVGMYGTAKDGHSGKIEMVSPDGKFVFIRDSAGKRKRKSTGTVTIISGGESVDEQAKGEAAATPDIGTGGGIEIAQGFTVPPGTKYAVMPSAFAGGDHVWVQKEDGKYHSVTNGEVAESGWTEDQFNGASATFQIAEDPSEPTPSTPGAPPPVPDAADLEEAQTNAYWKAGGYLKPGAQVSIDGKNWAPIEDNQFEWGDTKFLKPFFLKPAPEGGVNQPDEPAADEPGIEVLYGYKVPVGATYYTNDAGDMAWVQGSDGDYHQINPDGTLDSFATPVKAFDTDYGSHVLHHAGDDTQSAEPVTVAETALPTDWVPPIGYTPDPDKPMVKANGNYFEQQADGSYKLLVSNDTNKFLAFGQANYTLDEFGGKDEHWPSAKVEVETDPEVDTATQVGPSGLDPATVLYAPVNLIDLPTEVGVAMGSDEFSAVLHYKASPEKPGVYYLIPKDETQSVSVATSYGNEGSSWSVTLAGKNTKDSILPALESAKKGSYPNASITDVTPTELASEAEPPPPMSTAFMGYELQEGETAFTVTTSPLGGNTSQDFGLIQKSDGVYYKVNPDGSASTLSYANDDLALEKLASFYNMSLTQWQAPGSVDAPDTSPTVDTATYVKPPGFESALVGYNLQPGESIATNITPEGATYTYVKKGDQYFGLTNVATIALLDKYPSFDSTGEYADYFGQQPTFLDPAAMTPPVPDAPKPPVLVPDLVVPEDKPEGVSPAGMVYPGSAKPKADEITSWGGSLTKDGYIPSMGMKVKGKGPMTGTVYSVSADKTKATIMTSEGKKSTRLIEALAVDHHANYTAYGPGQAPTMPVPENMPLAALAPKQALADTFATSKWNAIVHGDTKAVKSGSMFIQQVQTPSGKSVARVHFVLTAAQRKKLLDKLKAGPAAPAPKQEVGDWEQSSLPSANVAVGLNIPMRISTSTSKWKVDADGTKPTHIITAIAPNGADHTTVTLKSLDDGTEITSSFKHGYFVPVFDWDPNKPKPVPKPVSTSNASATVSDFYKLQGWTATSQGDWVISAVDGNPSSTGVGGYIKAGGAATGTLKVEPGSKVTSNSKGFNHYYTHNGYDNGGLRKVNSDGSVIEIMHPGSGVDSNYGYTVITVPEGENADVLMQKAFEDLDMPYRPLTQEDAKAATRGLLKNLLKLSLTDNYKGAQDSPAGDAAMFTTAGQTMGIPDLGWQDVMVGTTDDGTTVYYWSPRVREVLASKIKMGSIIRGIGQPDPDKIESTLMYGTADTGKKWVAGMPTSSNGGNGAGTDASNLAGNGSFSSSMAKSSGPLQTHNPHWSGATVSHTHPMNLFARIQDYRAASHDAYGKGGGTGANSLQGAMQMASVKDFYPGGGMPGETLGFYAVDSETERQTLIKYFKSKGRDIWGGRPIEDIILTKTQLKTKTQSDLPIWVPPNLVPITSIPESYPSPEAAQTEVTAAA